MNDALSDSAASALSSPISWVGVEFLAMKSRWPSYSACYAVLPFFLWVAFLFLVVAPMWPGGRVLLGILLAPLPDDVIFFFFFGVVVVMPALALLLHVGVWVIPALRRRFRPHWSTHGLAFLLVVPPVLCFAAFMVLREPHQQSYTPVAPRPAVRLEEVIARDLCPFTEAPSLRETDSFSATPFDNLSLPKRKGGQGEITPYLPAKENGEGGPEGAR